MTLAGAGVYFGVQKTDNSTDAQFQTQPARQGSLKISVSATGTLLPTTQVDVGTEISGTVESINADFNDHVQKGQILAKLNPDHYEARVAQSKAALEVARAKVEESKATVLETRIALERCKELAGRALCAPSDLDSAQAAYARSVAQQQSAEAQVSQAEAALLAEETNLDKTKILAPIDGIVLDRKIEPGQTVAASLQTPLLFSIADDLRQMELRVAIDEADIGQVQTGQEATFSVDAYPDHTFPADIREVRFAPQTVAGVVSYEAILTVDNSSLLLRPGMTATADILVDGVSDALLVPNSALRFNPSQRTEREGRQMDEGILSAILPTRRGGAQRNRDPSSMERDRTGSRIWTLVDGQALPIPVTPGVTDGSMTELIDSAIEPGTPVIISMAAQND